MRFAIGAGTLGLAAMCVGGCHTVEGVGKDLQAGGRALSETSRDVRGEDKAPPGDTRERVEAETEQEVSEFRADDR